MNGLVKETRELEAKSRQSNDYLALPQNFHLKYGGSSLCFSDIELLQGSEWLNDTLIGFYFEYLGSAPETKEKDILCVSPQITQCIKIRPLSEISEFLDPLNANEKSLILFALNDHEECDKAGGSHWSLVVYSKMESIFHFDSISGKNFRQAQKFSEKILTFFSSSQNFIEQPCLQQNNGYDCGVHVLSNAQNIIAHFIKSEKIDGVSDCSNEDIKNFISNLFKNKY